MDNKGISPEPLQKAQQVQSAKEEPTALAREHGFEISPENAGTMLG